MKRLVTFSSVVLTALVGFSMSAQAQQTRACTASTPAERLALNAAKNEARQMAEAINGGLTVYRAESAMHGAATKTPCAMVEPGVWRFTFRGGEPSAVALDQGYTLLSVVTVNSAIGAERSISLDYNGPIEDYTGVVYEPATQEVNLVQRKPPAVSETLCVAGTQAEQRALNAAKNMARQAAEQANGGLSVYRAEPAMHRAAADAPCEQLGNNAWRFTFRGGSPTAVSIREDYTILSVVTVEDTGSDSTFVIEYNGPIEDYDS